MLRNALTSGLLAALLLCAATRVFAEDRVTFIPDSGGAPVTIVGTIREYGGQELIIQPAGKTPQSIPVSQIQNVETFYGPKYQLAISQFNEGNVETARQTFRQAMREESREWVQREQLSWIVRCEHRSGNLLGAALAFLQIVESDSDTQHWSAAPLQWYGTQIGASEQSQAKSWMAGRIAAEQLIGASWLLQDPTFGQPAERVLDELARNTNPKISQLARVQLWRLRFGPKLSDLTVAAWEHDVERMPESIQNGPRYLIGRAYLQRQEFRQAAAAFLWLPTVYDDHEPLAARACYEAAESLRRSGLTQEAENLYREVVARYAWTTEAKSARQNLAVQ
ncbi:MAG: hypothetical protein KDA88_20120 [Planctomycetaceae bacterium]|nr:hypothetical protein [Planctomycetaceae bacterium]MCB9953985.1 hypothetical protein [Planctomycetaceae bacterium]